ncbi:MAG: mechanosensitive ion channel [Burkholderiaceae bacterium]|nr:mechanosensitive ion channel [Burkholderiaceae bacterium]
MLNPPFGRPRRRAVRRWLCRAAALLSLSAVVLQSTAIELPGALASRAAPASAPATLSIDDWRLRLAQAREAHDRLMALPAGSGPLLADRQLASTRRLALMTAQLEAAQETAADAPHAVAAPAPPPRLDGPGPYSVKEVDALRDQLDDLRAQGSALRSSLGSLEADLRAAIEARGNADAALNLQRDRASRPLGGDDPVLREAQTELASMRAQIAGLEVLEADRARQRAQARLAALDEPTAQLAREVQRVRARQSLDAAALKLELEALEAEHRTIATERTRLEERIARRSAAGNDQGADRRREIEALQGTVTALRELQTLLRRQATLWRSRHDLLQPNPPADARRALAPSVKGALDQLAAEQRSVADRQALLRIELRTAAAEPGAAQRLPDALQGQMAALLRLEEALRRSVVLLGRTRDDVALIDGPATEQDWPDRTLSAIGDGLRALWQKELFSATETTVVDGQRVTLDYGVTVGKSIGLLVMLALGYVLAGALARLLAHQLERRLKVSAQFARVLRRWISSILMIAVVLVVLRLARIPLTAFAFLGGALAIGVGFGTQNIIKNLISGVIILLERKIHVGDVVTVGGMSGTVVAVDFRASTVRGFDGIDAIVPNSQLLENQISNWSGGGPSVRRIVSVGVAYGCDVRRAAELVARCASEHHSILQVPAPEVLLHDFGSDALVLRLLYWTRLGGDRGGPTVDSDLRFAIEQALREAGIAIAFPQRDVHLDLAGPVQVEMVEPARQAQQAPPAPV